MVQDADQSNQPILSKYVSPSDWPWTFSIVVSEARRILSYLNNAPEDARPPEQLWHSAVKSMKWIKEHMDPKNKEKGGMWEFKETEVEKA